MYGEVVASALVRVACCCEPFGQGPDRFRGKQQVGADELGGVGGRRVAFLQPEPSGEDELNAVVGDADAEPPVVQPRKDLQAAWEVDILPLTATASAAEHSAHREDSNAEQDWIQLRQALSGAGPKVHPHLHAQADNLLSGTPAERRRWSVETLLSGLLATRPEAK